ncbi:MAG: twin-arginine translocase TatA/TatE family subunit [Bacilli bacterium]
MPGNIGFSGLVIILLVALVVFGPKKLPEIGRSFGEMLREFKKGTNELRDDINKDNVK